MGRAKSKFNPIKILILLASLGLLGVLGTGILRNSGRAAWGEYLWSLPPLALISWSVAKTRRLMPRPSWQLYQLMGLLALCSLAVQRTGGLTSPGSVLYLLLALWAAFRTAWPWPLLIPIGALVVEISASFFNNTQAEDAPAMALSAFSLGLASWAGHLATKRGLMAAPADRLEFDEPQEPLPDLRDDIQALVELTHASLDARTVAVFLTDDGATQLKMVAHKSYSPELAKDARLESERSLLGWVARERQGLLYSEFRKGSSNLGYYRGKEKVGSLLAMPIMEGRSVLGLMVADSDQVGRFDEGSKMLAAAFARQASRLVVLNLRHTALGLEHERLREWNRRLEMMASRLKVDEVVAIMRDLIPKLVDCDRLVLLEMLPDPGRARVLLADPGTPGGLAAGTELDIEGSLAEQAFKLKEWRLVDDYYRRSIDLARYTIEESRDHGYRSMLVGPLFIDEDCRYLMALESRRPNAFGASLDTIHIVANQFSLALRSAAMYEEKESMALRDGLTGLWNHRHFQERLEQLLAPGRRQPLSLALFDIDRFKKLNDTYGHPVGDAVLREVAVRIKGNISQYDFAARYGGEEFVVVWPGSDLGQAERLAQELRQAIGGRPVSTQAGDLPVTVSLGLASYPNDAQDKGSLIQAADQALYAAKRAGRDRMICFRNIGPTTANEDTAG